LTYINADDTPAYAGQAYQLQLTWLREQGIEHPYKFLGIDKLSVYIFSSCPEF
jgi:hypothetical protein